MFPTLLCSTVSKWDTFSSFFGFSPMGEPVEIYQRGLPSSISFYSGLIIYRQDLALSFNSIAIHWMSLCRYVDIGYWDEQDKDPTHRELIELCYIPLWTFCYRFFSILSYLKYYDKVNYRWHHKYLQIWKHYCCECKV